MTGENTSLNKVDELCVNTLRFLGSTRRPKKTIVCLSVKPIPNPAGAGKVVERWDVLQVIPDGSAHEDGMF